MSEEALTEELEAVAIVGISVRLPTISTLDDLWKVMSEGVEPMHRFSRAEMAPYVPASELDDPNYVPIRGVLEDAECFDHSFFGVNPKEAQVMDPQQRVLIEGCWHALEDAGYPVGIGEESVGLYAGVTNVSYLPNVLMRKPGLLDSVGPIVAMTAVEKDYPATRTGYHLNLRGPCVNVHTACSTGLVGLHHAVNGLLNYQMDIALVGAASVHCPQTRGYLWYEGSITSKDGHCRPFDSAANGTLFSSGCIVLATRRLSDAVASGDHIYAVVKAAAINNDGADRLSFAAPSVAGQAEVVALAHAEADVDPETIGLLEAHGTGTALGDPIEVEALTQAFRAATDKSQFCALGSIKANLGHLDVASGLVGLLKAVLCLRQAEIPGQLHFESANPHLNLESSPFFVNKESISWPVDGPRRAGVSSFGTGGTNAHVILEEAPASEDSPSRDEPQLLVVSAKTEAALDRATLKLADHLRDHEALSISDVAFTLATGRNPLPVRRSVVARDLPDAVAALAKAAKRQAQAAGSQSVAFLFPGQGAQRLSMGDNHFRVHAEYTQAFEACSRYSVACGGPDLVELIYGDHPKDSQAIHQTSNTQPALFAVEYALAKQFQAWGVEPEYMIGHSIGEFVAATLADVMTLSEAIGLVCLRGRLMQQCEPGSMLSVRLPVEEVQSQLPEGLDVAAINGPKLTVVSGPIAAVESFRELLKAQDTAAVPLRTSHAFHSGMMDPILPEFRNACESVELKAPRKNIISTATGRLLTAEEATSVDYWTSHLRHAVQFSAAINTQSECHPDCALVELGPGRALSSLAKGHPHAGPVLATWGTASTKTEAQAKVLETLGTLWELGISVAIAALTDPGQTQRVSLPGYAFERTVHWVEVDGAPDIPLSAAAQYSTATTVQAPVPQEPQNMDRKDHLIDQLRTVFEDSSGEDFAEVETNVDFLSLGLDSLVLTQVSLALNKVFGISLPFRMLLEEIDTLEKVAEHLDQELPADSFRPGPAPAQAQTPAPTELTGESLPGASTLEAVIAEQLRIMQQQLDMIRGATPSGAPVVNTRQSSSTDSAPKQSKADTANTAGPALRLPPKGAESANRMDPGQAAYLADLQARYCNQFAASKKYAQSNRAHLSDPRTATGFHPLWKELAFPIVTQRSSGSRLWDIDGNEIVDLTNGFGQILFGHSPEFLIDAVTTQVQAGVEIGPQSTLAGPTAKLLCELTGHDRAAFCNTGSEAVLAAMRTARTVTGNDLICVFDGAYHGIFDEVILRGTPRGALPAAAGIPRSHVENMLVLNYDDPASLEALEDRAGELAAIMVEPVHARNPDVHPKAFLEALRRIADAAGCALIFDEVVTGFRCAQGGAQQYFNIKADIAAYGKVVGGGYPIGIVAGRKRFMDALDGGAWQFGDDSAPEVGVTFFAGTMVRHPVALAATHAILKQLEAEGPELQQSLNRRTAQFVHQLRSVAAKHAVKVNIGHFSSLFFVTVDASETYGPLLFARLREAGFFIWENRPSFLTVAHSDDELERFVGAFDISIAELLKAGLLTAGEGGDEELVPPVPGARRGRDENGNAAWFVADPDREDKFRLIPDSAATPDS